MKLSLAVNKDGTEEMLDFPFKDGLVELPDNWDATFDIVTGDDMILPCKCSKDPIFLVGFGFWGPFYLVVLSNCWFYCRDLCESFCI